MRSVLIAVAAAFALAACGKAPAPAGKAASEAAAPVQAPQSPQAAMSEERIAYCVSALESWDELGNGRPPGKLDPEQARQRRELLSERRMEREIAANSTMSATLDRAVEAWKNKTPSDIEAAAVRCLDELVE